MIVRSFSGLVGFQLVNKVEMVTIKVAFKEANNLGH